MSLIVFINSQSIEIAKEKLTGAITRWMQNWSFNSDQLRVEFEGLNQLLDEAESFTIQENSIPLQVQFSEGDWQDLVFNADGQNPPSDDVHDFVVKQAKANLLESVIEDLCGQHLKVLKKEKNGELSLPVIGDWSIKFNVRLAHCELAMVVPVIEELSFVRPKNGASDIKLNALNIFDLPNTMTASVDLDLGSFDIADLKNLSEGDVLSSSVPLTQEFKLSVKNKVIAEAFLGKQSANKAILIQKSKK
ncbi:hypothetical protein TDB9533_02877 [Thalassocella blandensis]|nr:hypothetical protein TDB9533_02877 [Thalassocella blandensis]